MDRFSEKIKIFYLTLVILFGLGVFVYLLDSWGVIALENHIPYLRKEPAVVDAGLDSPGELDREALRKREDQIREKEIELKELAAKLEGEKGELEKKAEEIESLRKSLADEKKRMEEEAQKTATRQLKVREMADRLGSMAPDDAIKVVAGWSNTDLVDVFLEMERAAVRAGRQSIVPFLITKLPEDRKGIITTMMLDANRGQLPPATVETEP
ncbi:MAG: hypothetical protein HS115_02835 [Spirochaetales bacterium]|nr:hypothetical protein [Spirochaetales bacterium]